MMMWREEWREVPGMPGVEVSNRGRVRKLAYVLLTQDYDSTHPTSYPRVGVSVQMPGRNYKAKGSHPPRPQKRRHMVHRLVAAAFLGECPPGYQVNHKDGNKGNARADNLEYVTASENQKHAYDHLGKPHNSGSRHGMARLDEQKVITIRLRRSQGATLKQIAAEFGVGVASVSMITTGKTWRHIL
jgi:hypothetical protein